MTIGEKIKSARKAKNITKKKLGELIGNETGTVIADWEIGLRNPNLESLKKLSYALSVPITYFIGEIEDNHNLDNPYWSNITAIADKQRRKGIETYGCGIEANAADIMTRLEYLQEELVDGLMYIEWIKDKLKGSGIDGR